MNIFEKLSKFNNIDCPFTEIFSLLKRYENVLVLLDGLHEIVQLSALIDIINFEKLLYGILSASYLKKLKVQLNLNYM